MPSLRTFITRLAQPQLLRELLQRHRLVLDANVFLGTPTAIAEAIEEELASQPIGTRALLAHDMQRVEQLATETGEVAIDWVTLHEDLGELPSRQARALYVLLKDPDGLRRAEEIVYNDSRRGGREWSAFTGRKHLDLASQGPAMEEFKEALRGCFDTRNVHVEVFDRSRLGFPDPDGTADDGTASLVQVTVYREDRPNTEWAFQPEGTLGSEVRRKVLEAALTYEPATGLIECVGRQRDSRAEMVRMMATTLLGCEPDFEPASLPAYDLSVLSERIAFESDPEDRIEDVRVAMLRLTPIESVGERITVECMRSGTKDMWTIAEERLGREALRRDYRIDQARLVVRHRANQDNRARSLTITITHPHRSNLKDQMEIERVVSSKYLPRWGLLAAA